MLRLSCWSIIKLLKQTKHQYVDTLGKNNFIRCYSTIKDRLKNILPILYKDEKFAHDKWNVMIIDFFN